MRLRATTLLAMLFAGCEPSAGEPPATTDAAVDAEAKYDARPANTGESDGSSGDGASRADGSTAADAAIGTERDGGYPSPLGEWVWQDIAGTACANGSPTGVGINRGGGTQLVIYMSGGSACLDENCSIG